MLAKVIMQTVLSPEQTKERQHVSGIKLHHIDTKLMEDHIHSFPAVPVEWCQKGHNKTVPVENFKQCLYQLCSEFCLQERTEPFGKMYWGNVSQNWIAFHIPVKDQCWFYYSIQNTAERGVGKEDERQLCRNWKAVRGTAKVEYF